MEGIEFIKRCINVLYCVSICVPYFFLCYLLICKCVVIFVNVPFAMNNLVLLKFLNCY